jgi:pSer/pThr/pTyr-binding forkhead associated (FHA) protein
MENKNSPFAKAEKDEVIRNSVLIAQQGPLEGQRWNISTELTIGRAPECDIQIQDRQVSRCKTRSHAEFDRFGRSRK